jgi:hypothetical protein
MFLPPGGAGGEAAGGIPFSAFLPFFFLFSFFFFLFRGRESLLLERNFGAFLRKSTSICEKKYANMREKVRQYLRE